MRTMPCFIDSAIVETRCDQRLRRYLLLRDATLMLPGASEAINANVVVTGIDCDHFGPLLRRGDTIEADVVVEDGCYFLVDRRPSQHADDRAYARQAAIDAARALAEDAMSLAQAALRRAVRA